MKYFLVVLFLVFPVLTAYAQEDAVNDHSTVTASTQTPDVESTLPDLSVDLARLSVVRGVVDITVTCNDADMASVRLLNRDGTLSEASGTVRSFQIDTRNLRDGVHWLSVEAKDPAGQSTRSTEVPVVVANNGTEVTVTYYPEAKYHIPENYASVDHHVRGMVKSDEGVTRIVSWLTWDGNSGFNMELAVGQGICPHRGIRYLPVESTSGEIIIDLPRSELSAGVIARFPAEDQSSDTFPHNTDPATFGSFFAHAGVMNPEEHIDETIAIDIHFLLFHE